jgi:hypothetical protein
MQLKKAVALGLVAAGFVSAAPAAQAAPGGSRGGDRAEQAQVPSRVATRLKRADRALERAQDAIDDGTSAASALKSVRTNTAAALKAAKKRAGSDNGPASIGAVASFQHKVIDDTAALLDGADDATVAELATTLDSAVTGRDEAIAAISALTDKSAYSRVLTRIDSQVAAEIEAIDEALTDDTLTDGAKTALTDAKAKLAATATVIDGLTASSTSSENVSQESGSTDAAQGEDCPEGEGRRGGRGQQGSQQQNQDTESAPQT